MKRFTFRTFKPILILMLSLIVFSNHGWSMPQDPAKLDVAKSDSSENRVDTLLQKVDTIIDKVDTINKKIAALVDTTKKSTIISTCVSCRDQPPIWIDWVLILLPALLFTVLFFVVMAKGLRDFNFKEAMSENNYPTIIEDNPQYTAANLALPTLATKENLNEIIPATIEKTYLINGAPPPPNASISRYIAFLSTILTLVIALSVGCFFIYNYIRTGCPPDLTGISTLLMALGIGILPYAFNKLSTAINKDKRTN